MDYSVQFENLITDISINPGLTFKQVRFIYSQSGGAKNPANEIVYPEIRGIEVFCHLDKIPTEGRKILEELETALYIAEEVFTGLVATTQGYCYLARPITCIYQRRKFVLEDNFWREVAPPDSVFRGGEVFLDEALFIDENKNFHPMFHFYRAAKDETNNEDYRALNAWRFLEALHGKSDRELRNYLVKLGQPQELVDEFYANVRCAVAHASKLKNNPLDESVILPKSTETQFNGNLILQLHAILDYLDSVVKKLNPQPVDIPR